MISRKRHRIDLTGLLLVVSFLGPLQVMLDRGEEANWFSSRMIVMLAIVWSCSLATLILREWNHKRPIVNLRLFKNRTSSIAALLMFVLGFVLYGSIVLLPQYVQVLLGWSAERAGMVLSPGGFMLMILMPVAGALVARFDSRWLIAVGFSACAFALYHMTIIDPQIDFYHAMMLRVYMAFGVAFLFVPINTMAYTEVPPEHNDDVSAMVNLARNVGGSVGIALSWALISERSQFHQHNLVTHATTYDGQLRDLSTAMAALLHHGGLSAQSALVRTYARVSTRDYRRNPRRSPISTHST